MGLPYMPISGGARGVCLGRHLWQSQMCRVWDSYHYNQKLYGLYGTGIFTIEMGGLKGLFGAAQSSS